MLTRLKGWLVPVLLLGVAAYAIAEEITLTTYYPSPRGVYSELRVGSGGPFPAPTGTLHVLKPADDGAAAFRVDDEDADASPFLIDQAGNVGIGTVSPGAKLELAGQIKITGGNPGVDKLLASDASGLAVWQRPSGIPRGVQAFTIPGSSTFTVPAEVTRLFVEVYGGGGGGSWAANKGGGGGAGGVAMGLVTVTPGESIPVTMGGGGSPGVDGGSGGPSSFGSMMSATGGMGGGAGGSYSGPGGAGGVGSGGQINQLGGGGAAGGYAGGGWTTGGSNTRGGGGRGTMGGICGGGGGTGDLGGPGCVIVWW